MNELCEIWHYRLLGKAVGGSISLVFKLIKRKRKKWEKIARSLIELTRRRGKSKLTHGMHN